MYITGDVIEITTGFGEQKAWIGFYQALKDIVMADLPKSLVGAKDTAQYLLDSGYTKEIDIDDWNFVHP